ncbi:MAG: FtsK/SpoIIIE domain-containing protein [Pseudonocardiaceae bacterium]
MIQALLVWLAAAPFRWVLGASMIGPRSTNATFLRPGTGWAKDVEKHRRPTGWELMPGARRGGYRTLGTVVVGGGLYAYNASPVVTAWAIGLVAAVAAGLGVNWLIQRWHSHWCLAARDHYEDYLVPLHTVLAANVGWGPDVSPRDWLHIPVTYKLRSEEEEGPTFWDRVTSALAEFFETGHLAVKRYFSDDVDQDDNADTEDPAEKLEDADQVDDVDQDDEDDDEEAETPTELLRDNVILRLDLPTTFSTGIAGDDEAEGGRAPRIKTALKNVVCEKLALSSSEVSVSWTLHGRQPCVEFRPRAVVPEVARAADLVTMLKKAPASAPIIGLRRGSKPVAVDFDSESPHLMAACGPGAGKSVMAAGLAAQLLAHDAHVVILDTKQDSLSVLADHPHVQYCRTPEAIHNFLVWLSEEVDRRMAIKVLNPDADFVRIVIIFEEMNAAYQKLKNHWAAIRDKQEDPANSPAFTGFGDVAFMGRAPKMNAIAIAQSGTAKVMGGPETREAFFTRVLGRYSLNAWKMLVPDVKFVKSSKKRGRMQVCIAGVRYETQVLLWRSEELREWAWSCFAEGTSYEGPKLTVREFLRGETRVTVTAPAAETASAETASVPVITTKPVTAIDANTGTAGETTTDAVVEPAEGKVLPFERPAIALPSAGSSHQVEASDEDENEDIFVSDYADEIAESDVSDEVDNTTDGAVEVVPEGMITLRQAVEEGIAYATQPDRKKALQNLRRARNRTGFPQVQWTSEDGTHYWAREDIQHWAANKSA